MSNLDKLCIFTDNGKCHFINGLDIPLGKFKDKGVMIDSISNYTSKENILLIVPFEQIKGKKLLFGNECGMLKIVPSEEFIATKKTVDSTK